MQILPSFEKKAVIRHFLGKSVLEDVLELGEEAFLVDELEALEVEEMGFQPFLHLGDRLEDAEGELTADDGGNLHDPFQVLLQAVHAGRDDPLDRIGDLDVGRFSVEQVAIVLLFDRAVLEQGMGELLHEEGIAGSFGEDQLPELGDDLSLLEDRLDEFGTGG